MPRLVVHILVAVSICLAAVPTAAQEPATADPPAHVSFVDGAALLERDGQIDRELTSMPLLAGDRLRTQGGRLEVLFADGSTLHLDANTLVDFQSDEVVRLLEGRIRLSIAGAARDVSYRVDAPSAWVQITDPGEYRIAVQNESEVELAVLRGAAELVNEQGRSYIRAGERTFARAGSAPSPPYVFNSAAWDAFDRWSEARRDQRLGVSAQYLPNDVRPYAAAFDAYGDWRHEQTHGYVWYPRVHAGWRPYYRGRWASLRPYGWTWIGADPWGWPTHHYGRWGISAGAWFWIPGRHWSPAWVSWAYAPGYVSWCPLGWNNRPVLQIVNVNVYGGRRYDPWHAWTVLPRHHFGRSFVQVANHVTVRVDARTRNAFVVRDRAPAVQYAVGRAAPIRSAGRYAVPRSGAAPSLASRPGGAAVRDDPNRSGAAAHFPAPARAPRAPSAVVRGDSPAARSTSRAVARTPGAAQAPRAADAAAPPARRAPSAEYRRAPDSAVPRANEAAPLTPAPQGAVRAVPRARSADEGPGAPEGRARFGVRQERQRPAPSRTPEYAPEPSRPSTPSAAPPTPDRAREQRIYRRPQSASPAPSAPAARPGPVEGRSYRRAPEAQPGTPGPEPRGRSMPRREAPSSAPSLRSAPERRAPSGPPPSAAPSRPSGDGGGARARQRPGGGASGGASRRRDR